MAIDLGDICYSLQQLGNRKPNPEARAQLNEALNSKWESVRLVAARTLARWGDEESMMAIRALLEDLAAKPHHRTPISDVAILLKKQLKPSEFEWLVELFLHKTHPDNRESLVYLFRDFPEKMVLHRMESEQEKAQGDERLSRAISIVIMRSKR